MAPYRLVDARLGELLREFGPPRKAVHTEFPFWRLQRDGVWELARTDGISLTSSGDAHKSALLRTNVHGGLIEDIYDTLRSNHRLAAQVASDLLAAHFQDTQYDDILQAVGIDPEFAAGKRRTMRDPGFRVVVLRAYEYRCAVCDFDVRIGARSVALDAAHIQWHQAGGPDEIRNGIALCVLHHKLFDAEASCGYAGAEDRPTCRRQRGPGVRGSRRHHRIQGVARPFPQTTHPQTDPRHVSSRGPVSRVEPPRGLSVSVAGMTTEGNESVHERAASRTRTASRHG